MQCKIFCGEWFEAQDAFNEWAKGKALTKQVIIHTIYTPVKGTQGIKYCVAIVVYHPEDEVWQKVN
jgi:hypothetical protein